MTVLRTQERSAGVVFRVCAEPCSAQDPRGRWLWFTLKPPSPTPAVRRPGGTAGSQALSGAGGVS